MLPDGEPNAGEQCGKRFDSVKALRTHAKSHQRRPCRWCGREFSNNGHTQHELACDAQPKALPWQVWDDLLGDLVAHATEIPDGMLCVVSTTRGAFFMRPHAAIIAASEILDVGESVVVIPTDLLSAPETVARWRRRQRFEPDDFNYDLDDPLEDDNDEETDDDGADTLFGVSWATIR